MNISEFYASADAHMRECNAFIEKYQLGEYAQADHLCFKCADAAEFEDMRRMLERKCGFLYQSIISQRRIAVIRLTRPIKTIINPIFFIELSDQKIDGSQKSGFDHIELCPKNSTYEYLVRRLGDEGVQLIEVRRPHHTTHDLVLESGFGIKLSQGPLIEKIKTEEMV